MEIDEGLMYFLKKRGLDWLVESDEFMKIAGPVSKVGPDMFELFIYLLTLKGVTMRALRQEVEFKRLKYAYESNPAIREKINQAGFMFKEGKLVDRI